MDMGKLSQRQLSFFSQWQTLFALAKIQTLLIIPVVFQKLNFFELIN